MEGRVKMKKNQKIYVIQWKAKESEPIIDNWVFLTKAEAETYVNIESMQMENENVENEIIECEVS
jgi:hypothetical protein